MLVSRAGPGWQGVGSEHPVRTGLGHDVQLVGLALEVTVLDVGPGATETAGRAETVGEVLGGLDVEDAVRAHDSIMTLLTIKHKLILLNSNKEMLNDC